MSNWHWPGWHTMGCLLACARTGVIVYWLLVGHPPFVPNCGADCGWRRGEDCHRCQLELCTKIQNGHVSFPASDWRGLSRGARDLVHALLQRSPAERLSAACVLEHDWIRNAGALPAEHPLAYASSSSSSHSSLLRSSFRSVHCSLTRLSTCSASAFPLLLHRLFPEAANLITVFVLRELLGCFTNSTIVRMISISKQLDPPLFMFMLLIAHTLMCLLLLDMSINALKLNEITSSLELPSALLTNSAASCLG